MNAFIDSHIRVLPELRAAQVERSREMFPCTNLYLGVKYDLGTTSIPDNFVRVNVVQALRAVARSNAHVMEVPEPLWLRFAPINLALILSWRISGLLRRRSRLTVAYSIENNTPERLLAGDGRLPTFVVRGFARVAGAAISLLFDRIAFGSDGARETYAGLPLGRGVTTRLFPELPAAATSAVRDAVTDPSAIFVGQLDRRKGILELLAAWAKIEAVLPEAKLTVVGDGPLRSVVREWVDQRPGSRRMVGFIQHEAIAQLLAPHRIAVAPSVPDGRWREQIGLPIGEALAHGLTVVTTSESGLADWLRTHGHRVVPTAEISTVLHEAILDALVDPLDRSLALACLPGQPGRFAADFWLHSTKSDR